MKQRGHRLTTLLLPMLIGLFMFLAVNHLAAEAPQDHRREDLHGVLSRHKLTPPLRGGIARLRYSPNGNFLLLQTPSTIDVLAKDPLRLLLRISAENAYPARFSADSERVIAVSRAYKAQQWLVSDASDSTTTDLKIFDVCLSAELSPTGKRFACFDSHSRLRVNDTTTGQEIYSTSIDTPYTNSFAILPLHSETPFSAAFGYVIGFSLAPLASHGTNLTALAFSPDENVIITGDSRFSVRVDLRTGQKHSMHGSIQKRLDPAASFLSDDELLVRDSEKRNAPMVFSVQSGELLASPAFSAEIASPATNSRYVFHRDRMDAGWMLFDIKSNSPIPMSTNTAADVFENELALYNNQGDLFLYRLGEKLPTESVSLPLNELEELRSAAVTPNLDKLALSLSGQGGVFQSSTGAPFFVTEGFSAASFLDSSVALLWPKHGSASQRVSVWSVRSGKEESFWTSSHEIATSNGKVLLEYASRLTNGVFLRRFTPGRGAFMFGQDAIPYELRALDPSTGHEQWKRGFDVFPPIPFADPQGDCVVLAWHAASDGARAVAKRNAGLWETFRKARISDQDTLFEAVDAATGQSIGSALVQTGSGPGSYDQAFAAGTTLILVKDGVRISLHSLKDGSQKARLVGRIPSANARANLLAIEERRGLLGLYDLASGEKLEELRFGDPIAYIHFSEDGERLLALTDRQEIIVLDVRQARAKTGANAAPLS